MVIRVVEDLRAAVAAVEGMVRVAATGGMASAWHAATVAGWLGKNKGKTDEVKKNEECPLSLCTDPAAVPRSSRFSLPL